MPSNIYENMLKEKRVFLLPDIFPWSGINVSDDSLTDGLVLSCSTYTGSNIGQANIKLPKKVFGDHIKGVHPVKICVGDTTNIFFRGFLTEENGELSDGSDALKIDAMDYKWYFSKVTRIRGRWFTSDDDIPSPYGSPNTLGIGKVKYEMFRGPVIREGGNAGYLQDVPCVFNEDGLPTCNTKTRAGQLSIFKYRRMQVTNGLQYVRKYNYGAQYWTFSSILSHIVYWWLNPYTGSFLQIKISNNSYSRLSRLKTDDSIPMDLSIEGMNPLEAIDNVIKNIPGKWTWYLKYQSNVVYIEIIDLDNAFGVTKKLSIGSGEKLAENPVNVAGITVTRNWEESASYLVLKGGKLRLTTTVELQPVWEPNTLSIGVPGGGNIDVDNLPFSSLSEFSRWKTYVTSDKRDSFTTEEKDLFERAYRYYCIPKEGGFLTEALDKITFSSQTELDGELGRMYSAIEKDLRKMFAQNVSFNREYGAPVHPEFENPVVFAYDEYLGENLKGQEVPGRRIVYFDKGYNLDSETGLIIFNDPQYCRHFTDTPSPEGESGVGEPPPEEGEDRDVNVTHEKTGNIPDTPATVDSNYTGSNSNKLVSRRIFCTLSISLDMPYMVGDNVFGLDRGQGGNFATYMDFEGNDLDMHVNAFYPVLYNANVNITPKTYTIAEGEPFAVNISSDLCESRLYPIEYTDNYEKYPNDNHKLLLKKLKNFKESILPYIETITANLGVLDQSYKLGDIIIAIENSKTEAAGSGYYGIRDYVSEVGLQLEGETKGYTTSITATNNVEFTPKDFEKTMQKTVRRPSILRGTYEKQSFLKEKTD